MTLDDGPPRGCAALIWAAIRVFAPVLAVVLVVVLLRLAEGS